MENKDLTKTEVTELNKSFDEYTPEENEAIFFQMLLKQYRDYLEKLENWDWKAVMKKLRGLGVLTSRAEFVQIADGCRSQFEASLLLVKRHVATSKVTQEMMPFVWAAGSRLWKEFTPDYISLEELVAKIEFIATMYDENFDDIDLEIEDVEDVEGFEEENIDPLFMLKNTLLYWEDILNEIIGEGETVTYDEAGSWTIRWDNWMEECLFTLYLAMQTAAEAEGKLSLKAFDLVQKLEQTFIGIADESAYFTEIKMWLAFVNGDAAAVDNWLARLLPHLDEDSQQRIFEYLGDLHKTPPVYAFTPADPVRAMFFYNKMLDNMDEE